MAVAQKQKVRESVLDFYEELTKLFNKCNLTEDNIMRSIFTSNLRKDIVDRMGCADFVDLAGAKNFAQRAEGIIEKNAAEGGVRGVRSIKVPPPPKFKEPPRSNVAGEGWGFQGTCWKCSEVGHRA